MAKKLRNYRAEEDDYLKAMKRAKREKTKLSIEVERFVYEYGRGRRVWYLKASEAIGISTHTPNNS